MSGLSHIPTPRTDAAEFPVFHRATFIDHARQLERELAVCERQRDELLAKQRPKETTPEGLLYRYHNDRVFHELVDRLAYDKFQSHLDK